MPLLVHSLTLCETDSWKLCSFSLGKSLSKIKKMSNPDHDEDNQGEVFLDESDIIHEVTVDDEGPFALFPFNVFIY